jgi:uncharacterized protein YheU (UPF0270 family)
VTDYGEIEPAVREQRTEAAASLIEGDATIVRRSIEQLLL